MKLAIVLSGGGFFGAWQAGAWRELSRRLDFDSSKRLPDLIVGASVGSLNGWAIAGGATPDELCENWLRRDATRFRHLPVVIRTLMERYPLRTGYAVTITDLLRLKPRIVLGPDVTWRHLAASCAIPGVLPHQRIDGRIYSDGGLLNPLPVWAAAELGATHIIALHALPEIPSSVLKPMVNGFRRAFGYHPPLPEGIELLTIQPERLPGSVRDAISWKRVNAERWLEEGAAAARNISIPNCFRQ